MAKSRTILRAEQEARLSSLPERHITFTHIYRKDGSLWQASWGEQGKTSTVYLGKDTHGLVARAIAAQREREQARGIRQVSSRLPCRHAEIHLNCEVCIRFATWQMRERQRVS